MRVLVTGGAGFIGSHLTDALLARGDDVAVLDDLSSGRSGRLDPQVQLHKLSIADAGALTATVMAFRPELICHLAAQIDVRASVETPAQDARVNILGTVNVLEAARAAVRGPARRRTAAQRRGRGPRRHRARLAPGHAAHQGSWPGLPLDRGRRPRPRPQLTTARKPLGCPACRDPMGAALISCARYA
jgi:uncharacterized protein YbjT (DUF2867 family)